MEEQDSFYPLQKCSKFPLRKVLVHPGSEKELLVELERTHVAKQKETEWLSHSRPPA